MSKLSWQASASKDWILLNGTAGTVHGEGNMAVSVKLLPSTTVNDTNTGGTITFTCLDCGNNISKSVFVKRCPLQENN